MKRKFSTFEEAQDAFYETHDALSDDSDREEVRVMDWAEDEGHEIKNI